MKGGETMARVSGPLMSFDASGKVADSVVFSKWKGRNYVRQWFKPANPKTAAQVQQRERLTTAVTMWHNEDASVQQEWNDYAKSTGKVLSGFNAYVRAVIEYHIENGSYPSQPFHPPS